MPVLHFLNVHNGDCSIIQHGSGRMIMVDVNNARQLTASEQIAGNFNPKSCPYVLLYTVKHIKGEGLWKVILAGGSHDGTWEHILATHDKAVGSIDLLLAPPHGRHSDRDHSFLDVLRPKLTFFGNASSKYLAYAEWSKRGLPIITNNQAGSIVVDFSTKYGSVFVTNQRFAEANLCASAFFDDTYKGWLAGFVR